MRWLRANAETYGVDPDRIGIAGEEYFEVLDGLKDGERIVAGSYQAIRTLHDSSLVREAKRDGKGGPGAAPEGAK